MLRWCDVILVVFVLISSLRLGYRANAMTTIVRLYLVPRSDKTWRRGRRDQLFALKDLRRPISFFRESKTTRPTPRGPECSECEKSDRSTKRLHIDKWCNSPSDVVQGYGCNMKLSIFAEMLISYTKYSWREEGGALETKNFPKAECRKKCVLTV